MSVHAPENLVPVLPCPGTVRVVFSWTSASTYEKIVSLNKRDIALRSFFLLFLSMQATRSPVLHLAPVVQL